MEKGLEPVKAKASLKAGTGTVNVDAGGYRVVVRSELEDNGPSPLALLASALASCEALMFEMIAGSLGVEFDSLNVEVEMSFEVGYGLRWARITYNVEGCSREEAERIARLVARLCPVYRTMERSGARIVEDVKTSG